MTANWAEPKGGHSHDPRVSSALQLRVSGNRVVLERLFFALGCTIISSNTRLAMSDDNPTREEDGFEEEELDETVSPQWPNL